MQEISKGAKYADFGITYEWMFKAIDNLRSWILTLQGLDYAIQGSAGSQNVQKTLELRNIKTYIHRPTPGYPTDINAILSEEGWQQ